MVVCLGQGADLHMAGCCHCHSLSLASVNSRLVLPFWYRLTQAVPDKGPAIKQLLLLLLLLLEGSEESSSQFLSCSSLLCRCRITTASSSPFSSAAPLQPQVNSRTLQDQTRFSGHSQQESLANAKINARQHCVVQSH